MSSTGAGTPQSFLLGGSAPSSTYSPCPFTNHFKETVLTSKPYNYLTTPHSFKLLDEVNERYYGKTTCKGRYTWGVLLPEHAPCSFCTCQHTRGSVFKLAKFAAGDDTQIFNWLNIVEHFAGWKFCSRGWSIPMKSLVHTEELCSWSVPLEHAPGEKSLVCIGLNLGTLGNDDDDSSENVAKRENLHSVQT